MSSATVSVIDTCDDVVIDTISVDPGPIDITISQDGSRVYTVSLVNDSVNVIDTSTNTVINTFSALMFNPLSVALTLDGSKLYVAATDRIRVFDPSTGILIATITNSALNLPYQMQLTPDGTKLYAIAHTGTSLVVDVATDTVVDSFFFPGRMYDIAFVPDGSSGYLTIPINDDVHEIDTSGNTLVDTIAVGNDPQYIGITPDGKKVYLSNNDDNTIMVIDIATNTVTDTITVGSSPMGLSIKYP